MTLFHTKDGNKVEFFTPLYLDDKSKRKNDTNTFLFSLTKNKKYEKINISFSICCSKTVGPYSEGLGFNYEMKKITHHKAVKDYFRDSLNIFPSNEVREVHYDLL